MSNSDIEQARRHLNESKTARQFRERRERQRAAHAAVWFYSTDAESAQGPVSAEQLSETYASGDLPGEILLWREGMSDWLCVDSEQALLGALAVAAPAGGTTERETGAGVMNLSMDLPPPEPQDRVGVTRAEVGAHGGESAAQSSDELALIGEVSALVSRYMDELAVRVGDVEIGASEAGQQRFLAFELGVLEFYRSRLLADAFDSRSTADQAFYGLIVYHAGEHYPQHADQVIELWHDWLAKGSMRKVRELGFDSMRDGLASDGSPIAGHYPADYLRRAL